MGIKEMNILFDNPWATYYVGGTVAGQLMLTLESPKKVKEISMKIKGEAEVKWSEVETVKDSTGKDETRDIDYTASEKYFENSFILLASGAGDEVEIPAGSHTYNFSAKLPDSLPSSFESQFGYVRYTVKAILNRPWKFDQECKAAFTVVSPLDLNKVPESKEPINIHKEKFIGFCCCKSGPLSATLQVPISGFVSGQIIPVSLEVENLSDKNTGAGICSLNKVVTYNAQYPVQKSKFDKVGITEVKLGVVGAHSANKWTENLIVPALPPSNLQNCTIMDVKYEIKVDVKVPGLFYRGLHFKTPIVFGTVPLAAMPSAPPAPKIDGIITAEDDKTDTQPSAPSLGWSFGGGDGKNSLYPTIPSPTFEEAMPTSTNTIDIRDKDDSEHTQIAAGWVPRYPTYNFTDPSNGKS
ncbi:hypothetical protein RUM43_000094 [Polyplax serrata]|uniref:Arrestin C-terminal-like domain-containing protein n=1 Tax=Polyplax serrata TaxID=468196 RepID=A0AAN8SFD9_POLSC